jgi:tetratricopeptide (TPR) repeat protein
VAGALGSHNSRAYAVSGDTVNTAARLQSAAGPGEILASAATQAITQHLFDFEPHASLLLRGRSEPVTVYRLCGLLGQPRGARGLEGYGLSAPLVGRDDELAQMLAAFERARRGRAQVITLIGEAGQGKTRLVGEFLNRLAGDGITVRRFACSSLGEQTYGIFASFVREAYGIARDDSLATARAKLAQGAHAIGAQPDEIGLIEPMLAHLLGLHEETKELEPETVQRQIYGAWRMLVERRLRRGPLVAVLEDVQWSDAASLELLQHLTDRLTDHALTIVLTHRPSFQLSAPVSNRVGHTAIRLAPLTQADVEALLSGFFGTSAGGWPAPVRSLLVARSGGNPLYLEELVRNMIARGLLRRTDEGWHCADDAASVELPPTIQGLLTARLDQIPAQARRVLQEAAVLGPRFDFDLLRRITAAPATLDAIVEALLDGELIEEISAPGETTRRFRFTHGLLHEATYANLLVRRRTELHASAAAALEQRVGGETLRMEDLESLAHHFSLSGSRRKAAGYLVQAADHARGIYANEDAVRLYQRALDALEADDPADPDVLAVHERLGDLFRPLGRRAPAFQHYSVAHDAYEALGRHADLARMLRKIGGLRWDAGEREAALGCFHAGLELLAATPDRIERAHLCQELGRYAFRGGDFAAARSWCERALAELGGLEDTEPDDREAALALSYAHNTLGITLARMQQLDQAVRHIERSVSVAERHDLLNAAGRGYANLSMLYAVVDAGRGIELCGHGLDIARRIGDYCLQSRLQANLALAYCALADQCDDQAIDAAQASIKLDRALEQRDHLAMPLIVLGQIHQCRGEHEAALACYREALALAQEAADPQLLFPCYEGLATLFLDAGDQEQAEHYLKEADAVGRRSQLSLDSLVMLPFLA